MLLQMLKSTFRIEKLFCHIDWSWRFNFLPLICLTQLDVVLPCSNAYRHIWLIKKYLLNLNKVKSIKRCFFFAFDNQFDCYYMLLFFNTHVLKLRLYLTLINPFCLNDLYSRQGNWKIFAEINTWVDKLKFSIFLLFL